MDSTLISSQLGLLQAYLKSIKKVLLNDKKGNRTAFWKRMPIAKELYSIAHKNLERRKQRVMNDVNRLLEIEELKRELHLERERSKSKSIFADVLFEDITGRMFDLSLLLYQCGIQEDDDHVRNALLLAKGFSYYVNTLVSNFQEQKVCQILKHDKHQVHYVDPDKFIETIIRQAQCFATKNNCSLVYESTSQGSYVRTNEAKFGRIVNNLILTSLLSASAGSQIRLYSRVETAVWQFELTVNDIGRPVDIINDETADFRNMNESISAAFSSKNILVANAIHLCKVLNIDLVTTSEIGSSTTYKLNIPLVSIESNQELVNQFESDRPIKVLLLESSKVYTDYVTDEIASISPQAKVVALDYSDPAVLSTLMEKPDMVFLPFGPNFKNTIPIVQRFKSIHAFKECKVVCYGSSTMEDTITSLKQAGTDFLLFLPHTELELRDILFHTLKN
ncbi:hypothetical protein [Chitinophaga varians]|nr:hypothetical protein [Chitinophaga varians]